MLKSKKYFIKKEREFCLEQMAKLEIDIEVLRQLNPDTVIGQRKLTDSSMKEILAKEGLDTKKQALLTWQARLLAIESLLRKQ